ncbi:MAG TPA: tetratricopeptide repeat protein [Thermoanaerobaculia bacterium]
MAVQRDKVIASAEKLVAKGKIEPAIKEYERLLDDNPNDVNTLNRIGDLWVRINRNEEAVKVFSKIADHYSKDGFFLKAIAIFKKINKLDPSKLDIYAKLADLYAKQGLAMEAKSQYQVLADYYLKHGDPGNALAIYRKISELDPNSINVHVKLADLYSQNNQTAEALKEYDRVGRMLLKRGMLDEAVQVFRKALKIDPKNTELVDSLVTALLEAKDFDNATQIVDAALEVNANNPRLLALLGRIQLARGDVNAARATLERGLAADENDSATREALADLYLRQNNSDRALEMLIPTVERAMSRGERSSAVEALNRVLRIDAGHTPTLERLVAVYTRLNEETSILAAMNSLAEAHMAKGKFDEAARVLDRLIDREPQNAQHRTKLQFVRSQMGGVDTIPAGGGSPRPRTQETPMPAMPPVKLPPMEIEEPPPTFDFSEDDGGLTLDLDASPAIDLDFSTDTPAHGTTPPPPTHLVPAVEMAAADLASGAGDDLDFITEHLTEAEVFAKYGLAEKAAEHLRAVLERAPKNLTAHERLFRILLDEGDVDSARTAAQAYIAVLDERGEAVSAGAVRNEFLTRGHSFDAPAPVRPPGLEEVEEELTLDLDQPEELEFDLDATDVEPEPEPEPVLELTPEPAEELIELVEELPEPLPEFEEPTFSSGPEITFDDTPLEIASEPVAAPDPLPEPQFTPEPQYEEPQFTPDAFAAESQFTPEAFAPEALTPEPQFTPEPQPAEPEFTEIDEVTFDDTPAEPLLELDSEPALAFDEPVTPLPVEEPLAESAGIESLAFDAPIEPETAEPFFGVEAVHAETPGFEEIGEIDFYIEQELFDEARRKVDALLARFPGNADLERRQARIDAAAAAAATPAAQPQPQAPQPPQEQRPPALSRDEIESELLSAIPDDDDDFTPAAPIPAPQPAVQPAFTAATVQEENLFADEEDFFDLAAELESELNEEDEQISLSEEEQSLEEIFKEFKKGVEQQLDSEDYDTHYNLGIAYKEMGLIDEAIGEFQLASKDPKRAVECASMLGLCFLEKGMPQLAIKWYRKGLEMPEITEEEHIGLLYDLGCAHQETGDTDNAQRAFMEVYGMNSNYRDIVLRIKQLEDARK